MVKNLPANTGDAGLIPESGRSSGEGNGNPLQYSCLGNPMDRGAWGATVHGVIKSDTTGHACTQAVDFNSKLFDGTSQVAPVVKNPLANARGMRDMGLIPGSGRSPGVGNGNPL